MDFVKLLSIARSPEPNEGGGVQVFSAESFKVEHGEVHSFRTGIAIDVPEGQALILSSTHSMGVKGVNVAGGFVTSEDRGELRVSLTNGHRESFEVCAGMPIAIGFLVDVEEFKLNDVTEKALAESEKALVK